MGRLPGNLRQFAGDISWASANACGGWAESRCVAALRPPFPSVADLRNRRVNVAERGLGPGDGNAARGDRLRPAPGAGSAGNSSRYTRSLGTLPACVSARSLQSFLACTRASTSRVPGCRHHAGDRVGHRPRQSAGHGADAPAADFSRDYSPNVVETFAQRIPGVTTNNVQGNEFATDLRYRGFAASPLQGTPQGLAVYMQGIRINEAFGDTVNWDLIPKVAIGRSDVWTNNPAFGLNALGGAISFQMKDGFNY